MGEKVDNDNSVTSRSTEASSASAKENSARPTHKMSQTKKVLLVQSHADSISTGKYPELLATNRERRASRLQRHGISLAEVKVGFSTLTIREHPVTIGDNPGGVIGPPLAIEWEHEHEVAVAVDEYEKLRPPRRHGREMIIPKAAREDLLRKSGLTRSDIIKGTKPVNIARAQRRRTQEMQGLSSVEEIGQSLTRKAKNLFSLGSRKRNEKKYIESALSFGSDASDEQVDVESA